MTIVRAMLWAVTACALSAVLASCGQAQAGTRPTVAASAISAPVASRACFGAAARAPGNRCAGVARTSAVIPSIAVAAATPNAPCNSAQREGPLYVCAFGAPADRARRTIALIGDSHAAMWRAALAPIARAEHWRGFSIVHAGCPFSALTRQIGGTQRDAACTKWRRAVVPWLRRNPQVSAMFVGGLSDSPFIRPRGEPNFTAAVGGYHRIWAQVPATVKHIVIMRDTPRFGFFNLDCIGHAIAARLRPGLRCAVPRPIAVPPDPEVVAAVAMHSPRFQTIDVDDEMCGPRFCYPVVGGALVLKDLTHLTRSFAATLAPAVMTQVQALTRSWAPAGPTAR